jgi:hypothetical protein
MNKFIISLCVILLITLCACGTKNVSKENTATSAQPKTQEEQAAADGSSSSNGQTQKEIKIEILPPSGWEPVEGSVLPVQYMKSTSSFMVKKEDFQSKAIDDVVSKAKETFESAFGKITYIGEPESIMIDGNDARKIIFTCEVSNMQMKYEYVYLFAGGSVYAITFGGPSDTFDSLSADYDQILTDIRFKSY